MSKKKRRGKEGPNIKQIIHTSWNLSQQNRTKHKIKKKIVQNFFFFVCLLLTILLEKFAFFNSFQSLFVFADSATCQTLRSNHSLQIWGLPWFFILYLYFYRFVLFLTCSVVWLLLPLMVLDCIALTSLLVCLYFMATCQTPCQIWMEGIDNVIWQSDSKETFYPKWHLCTKGYICPDECIDLEGYIWLEGYIDPEGYICPNW